ncbi:putative uncharacterized protein DDB_G0290521 [Trifolium pratense]|uniref:putative uncharacterized protein DDB_G0290521 n=1 Tax=Trifolium pratense TaxID=57577 RepID=UPI001E696309|nr:putative uncharacterized protein DDB_G0290521 [Trifolium pratense]
MATPENQSSEVEAQPGTPVPPENPPPEQTEKKKKHRKSPISTTAIETPAVTTETPSVLEAAVDNQTQPQGSPQAIPQDNPSPSKVAEEVVEEPTGVQHETVLEKASSPQAVDTAIPNRTPSPKTTGSPPHGAEDDTLKLNNEEIKDDQGLTQENPLSNPAQVSTASDPPTNVQADHAANLSTEQRPSFDGEHSTTNQPQPSGPSHDSDSMNANTTTTKKSFNSAYLIALI